MREAIAIVGMACRLPGGSTSPEGFWRLLRDGRDGHGELPADRWEPSSEAAFRAELGNGAVPRCGHFLDDVRGFDAAFFGISPREADQLDPQQRLLLELSWEALEDAGLVPAELVGSDTAVYVGTMWNDYRLLSSSASGRATPHTGTGCSLNMVSNRVSYTLGLTGPSLTVDTACSSSLVAVHLACQSLATGESSLALVGGVNLILSPAVYAGPVGMPGDTRRPQRHAVVGAETTPYSADLTPGTNAAHSPPAAPDDLGISC